MSEILKIEAAGNDFIFFAREQGIPTPNRIQSLCDRHFGIGADGFVVMENLDATHSRWEFFNNDGSRAAMCGNAARGAAAWVKHAGLGFPHHLRTDFGDIVLDEHVLREPHGFSARVPYDKRPLKKEDIGGAVLIDTGVPHSVVEMTESVLRLVRERSNILRAEAAKFRWPKAAGDGGSNVTFFSRIQKNAGTSPAIESVTFERGVEDLTLACGTGVLAAAVVASGVSVEDSTNDSANDSTKNSAKNQLDPWPKEGFEVRTPGATIWVESENFPKSLALVGPANVVFSAKLISSR